MPVKLFTMSFARVECFCKRERQRQVSDAVDPGRVAAKVNES